MHHERSERHVRADRAYPLDDHRERRGRVLLLGKGAVLTQRVAGPLAAELDENQACAGAQCAVGRLAHLWRGSSDLRLLVACAQGRARARTRRRARPPGRGRGGRLASSRETCVLIVVSSTVSSSAISPLERPRATSSSTSSSRGVSPRGPAACEGGGGRRGPAHRSAGASPSARAAPRRPRPRGWPP